MGKGSRDRVSDTIAYGKNYQRAFGLCLRCQRWRRNLKRPRCRLPKNKRCDFVPIEESEGENDL